MKSRLEAQTAHLFDLLEWKWEYEPYSIMLPDGSAYIPDFYIAETNLFVEARGIRSEKGPPGAGFYRHIINGTLGRTLPQFQDFDPPTFALISLHDLPDFPAFMIQYGDGEGELFQFPFSPGGAYTKIFGFGECAACRSWMVVSGVSNLQQCRRCRCVTKPPCLVYISAAEGRLHVSFTHDEREALLAEISDGREFCRLARVSDRMTARYRTTDVESR